MISKYLIKVNEKEHVIMDSFNDAQDDISKLVKEGVEKLKNDYTKVYTTNERNGDDHIKINIFTQSLGTLYNGSLILSSTIECLPVLYSPSTTSSKMSTSVLTSLLLDDDNTSTITIKHRTHLPSLRELSRRQNNIDNNSDSDIEDVEDDDDDVEI